MSLFGGIKAAFGAAQGAAEVVDKLVTTKGERLELEQKDAEVVRTMLDRTIHGTKFDSLVDGLTRLIRPGVTVYLLLGVDGRLVHLPDPGTVDPFWLNALYLVLTFWFGGRMILKDLPKAMKFILGLRKKI